MIFLMLILCLTDGNQKKLRQKQSLLKSLANMGVGDMIVHESFGVGLYRGLKNLL